MATEAYERLVEQAVGEFEARTVGTPSMIIGKDAVAGGVVEVCGLRSDPMCWAAAFIRDGAVLPLAAGDGGRVVRECHRLKEDGVPIWDPDQFPLPTVIVDATAYHFAPFRGRFVLGAVKLDRRAVLLAALGGSIAVIHVAGRTRTVLHVGRPHSFRELDVDQLVRFQRRGGRVVGGPAVGPIRPSPTVQAQHQRMVRGLLVDVGAGPTIPQVLYAAFEDLAARARGLKAAEGQRLRGKREALLVARIFLRLALKGVGNMVGRVGELLARIREHFPDFDMTPDTLSDVLALFLATQSCLISPRDKGARIWQINLLGLDDPRSAQHRRFCRETKGRHTEPAHAVADAATVSPEPREAPGPKAGAPEASQRPSAAPDDTRRGPAWSEPTDTAATTDDQIDVRDDGILAVVRGLPPAAGALLLTATNVARAHNNHHVAKEEPRPSTATDDEAGTIAALRSLPPEVGPLLLSAVQLARRSGTNRPPAEEAASTGVATPTAPPAAAAPVAATPVVAAPTAAGPAAAPAAASEPNREAASPTRPRRRRHLSPDHMFDLPRVASLVTDHVGGTPRGPTGARGPPS